MPNMKWPFQQIICPFVDMLTILLTICKKKIGVISGKFACNDFKPACDSTCHVICGQSCVNVPVAITKNASNPNNSHDSQPSTPRKNSSKNDELIHVIPCTPIKGHGTIFRYDKPMFEIAPTQVVIKYCNSLK